MIKEISFTVVYLIVLILHIYAGGVENEMMLTITKPALVSLLIIYFALHIKVSSMRFAFYMLAALFFSLLGDALLMFQDVDDSYFIAGLGAFLGAHIFYITAFTRTYLEQHAIPFLRRFGWALILVVGYGMYFFNLIKDDLGGMLGPVMIYTLVIIVMLLIALNRFEKVGTASFWLITAGALLFVASDSLLAYNKFVRSVEMSHLLIMGTYGLAQLGITLGGVRQMRDIAGTGKST